MVLLISTIDRSSWSRCGGIHEVSDVSEEEALEYLRRHEIKGEKAAQIYELVGGRMIDLSAAVEDVQAELTFQGKCIVFYRVNAVRFL